MGILNWLGFGKKEENVEVSSLQDLPPQLKIPFRRLWLKIVKLQKFIIDYGSVEKIPSLEINQQEISKLKYEAGIVKIPQFKQVIEEIDLFLAQNSTELPKRERRILLQQ